MGDDIKRTLAFNVRRMMKEGDRRVSYSALERRFGKKRVLAWVEGKTWPGAEEMAVICEALGAHPCQLFAPESAKERARLAARYVNLVANGEAEGRDWDAEKVGG